MSVVTLKGANDAFSSRVKFRDFDDYRGSPGNASSYDEIVESACRSLDAIPQSVVAAVSGVCYGAGLSLASTADIIIASTDAKSAQPAGKLGIGYDVNGRNRAVNRAGPRLVAELIVAALPISAERMHRLGYVSKLASPPKHEEVVSEYARVIASNAPLTLMAAKAAIRAVVSGDGLEEAIRLTSLADASSDYAEGREAFSEKRAPKFVGK